MKLAVLLLAVLSVSVQEQDPTVDADGHLKTEHQIPAGHYCQRTQVYEENAARLNARGLKPENAHPCACTYACHVDANGNVTETGGEAGTGCKSYCSKDGRRCTCHVEEPCDLGHHVVLKDMNDRVVAISRR